MPNGDSSSDGLHCSPDVWTCGGDNVMVGPKLMVGVVRCAVHESGIQQSGRVTIRYWGLGDVVNCFTWISESKLFLYIFSEHKQWSCTKFVFKAYRDLHMCLQL